MVKWISTLSFRRKFLKNEDGIAAVEFALVMPILITLFLGAVEFSHAITVQRKVVALTSATADLVSQTKKMNPALIGDVFDASAAIISPYPPESLTVVITSVFIDEDGNATTDWSRSFQGGSERAVGSNVEIPANLQFPNSYLIMSETGYDFTSVVGKYLTNGVHMSETFYLRPRASPSVEWEN